MKTSILLAALLAASPLAFLPTASAGCPDELADCVDNLREGLDEFVYQTPKPGVRRNADDNSVSIYIQECDAWTGQCTRTDVYRTEPLPTGAGARPNPDGTLTVYYTRCTAANTCGEVQVVRAGAGARTHPDGTTSAYSTTCDANGVCTERPLARGSAAARTYPDGTVGASYTTCDANGVCTERLVARGSAAARTNPDGSVSAYYTTCDANGVCTERPLVRAGTCFTYHPDALTNACVTPGTDPTLVPHPAPAPTTRTTCVIGAETCTTHAWVTLVPGGTLVPVPTAEGYVEATLACGLGAPCRVTLP